MPFNTSNPSSRPVLASLALCASLLAWPCQAEKADRDKPMQIDDLAAMVHMSNSAFHHHFKIITALTPLQYQKMLRLQHARQLMISADCDATHAAVQVGYASPSQFSREYRRLFGESPSRDVARWRHTAP